MMLRPTALNISIPVARRRFLREQRRLSTTPIGGADPSTKSLPLILVPRRAFLRYKEQMKPFIKPVDKNSTEADEHPWPRKVVYAAYAAAAIFIPYTAAWFLSTNARMRSMLFTDDQSALMNRMRHHFGVEDWESISEPEILNVDKIPHKFVDEPTARIRKQQAWIDKLNQGMVTVRLYPQAVNNNVMTDDSSSGHVMQLEARTPARHEEIVKALNFDDIKPPVAIDFPGDESAEQDANISNDLLFDDTILDDATTKEAIFPSMSIYSLWHYQAPVAIANNNTQSATMSETALEVSRLNHEISSLQNELHQAASSQRPIDDIREELRQLQSAKRRLQWKEWIPWTR
jgi:hypothetical protein